MGPKKKVKLAVKDTPIPEQATTKRKRVLKDDSIARPPSLRVEELLWYPEPHHLGGGGCGQAHLWLAVDDNERIVERVVVKDCYLSIPQWRDMHEWQDDLRDYANREHREIHFHRLIHGRDGQIDGNGREFLARMYHAESYPEEMGYRLYLQYYAHKDLTSVEALYTKAGKEWKAKERAAKATAKSALQTKKRKHVVEDDEDEQDDQLLPVIPEPFLWSVFECLARACLILEQPEKGSLSIVHRDIKLENVYLDAPNPDSYPSYPQAILADFGLAIKTSYEDARNPGDFVGVEGTDFWRAPEMIPMLDRKTQRRKPVGKLGTCTNIWGIAGVIIALMNRNGVLYGANIDDFKTGESRPYLNAETERYSEELRALVEECTSYWPNERPQLANLLARIQAHTDGSDEVMDVDLGEVKDLAAGMRHSKHRSDNYALKLLWHKDDLATKTKLARQALDDLKKK